MVSITGPSHERSEPLAKTSDLKTGHLLGCKPIVQFYAQLCGAFCSIFLSTSSRYVTVALVDRRTAIGFFVLFVTAAPCIIDATAYVRYSRLDEVLTRSQRDLPVWRALGRGLALRRRRCHLHERSPDPNDVRHPRHRPLCRQRHHDHRSTDHRSYQIPRLRTQPRCRWTRFCPAADAMCVLPFRSSAWTLNVRVDGLAMTIGAVGAWLWRRRNAVHFERVGFSFGALLLFTRSVHEKLR